MNAREKEDMVDALGEALCWLHENGNRHGAPSVQLTDNDIVCSLTGYGGVDILGNIDSIDDIFGPFWSEELDTSSARAVVRRLYECAEDWVSEFGESALQDAKERMEEMEA